MCREVRWLVSNATFAMSRGTFATMTFSVLFVSALLCSAAPGGWGDGRPERPEDLLSIPTSGSVLLDRWDRMFSGIGNGQQGCLSIPSAGEICTRTFGYRHAMFPNLLNLNQEEVSVQFGDFKALFQNSSCSEEFLFLICTYYFPPCVEKVPISACRGLCQRVRNQCEPKLRSRVQWPDTINCDELLNSTYIDPQRGIAHICVPNLESLPEATRASPPVSTGPTHLGGRTGGDAEQPTEAATTVPTQLPTTQADVAPVSKKVCKRKCKTLRLRRRFFKNKLFSWILRGVAGEVDPFLRLENSPDLACFNVTIEKPYFSRDVEINMEQVQPSVTVCKQTPDVDCPHCVKIRTGRHMLFAGDDSRNGALLMNPFQFMHIRCREDCDGNLTTWLRRYYPSEGSFVHLLGQ